MSTTPPEWFQIAGPITFSTALTICLYWQPKWAHRLFTRLVSVIERVFPRLAR